MLITHRHHRNPLVHTFLFSPIPALQGFITSPSGSYFWIFTARWLVEHFLPHLTDSHWILSTNKGWLSPRQEKKEKRQQQQQRKNIYYTRAGNRTPYFPELFMSIWRWRYQPLGATCVCHDIKPPVFRTLVVFKIVIQHPSFLLPLIFSVEIRSSLAWLSVLYWNIWTTPMRKVSCSKLAWRGAILSVGNDELFIL